MKHTVNKTAHLVEQKVLVTTKDGKSYYRKQWIKPETKKDTESKVIGRNETYDYKKKKRAHKIQVPKKKDDVVSSAIHKLSDDKVSKKLNKLLEKMGITYEQAIKLLEGSED